MPHIKQFHQPKLSLWQSAVDETLARRAAARRAEASSHTPREAPLVRPGAPPPIMEEAAEYCSRQPRASEAFRDALNLPGGDDRDTICFCSTAALKLAEAKILCNQEDCERYEDDLKKFGDCDPLYAEAALKYAEYFIAQCKKIPYRAYENITDFVIEDKLPPKARVAILGDWGTGQEAALRVLAQIAAKHPDAVIHLGDVYYSGTAFEAQNYFYNPWSRILNLADTRIPTFTLSGNHDMYSGGCAYYNLLDQLGQPASYFCLRNAQWQFLAMDTGLHDANPSWNGAAATYLEEAEVAWHKDKIDGAAGRRTVLLSHHPLFTAYEQIEGGAVNLRLYSQLKAFFHAVDLWLWGHEHRFVVYEAYLGVKRARCLGHAAFPISVDEVPPAPKFPQIPLTKDPDGRPIALGSSSGMVNHGYAIIDLDGRTGRISYYQDSDEGSPMFEEELP